MSTESNIREFKFKDAHVNVDLNKHFSQSWQEALDPLFKTEYFNALMVYLNKIYSSEIVDFLSPKLEHVFEPFKTTNPDRIKVVIVGAGPAFKQSNGLLFGSDATNATEYVPLLKGHENFLCKNKNERHYFDTTLRDWEDQDVLLLNSRLILHTVVPSFFADIFNYFILNVLNYLSELNSELVMAGVTQTCHNLIDKVNPNGANNIKVIGYLNERAENGSLYDLINEKLKELHESKIEWVSRV